MIETDLYKYLLNNLGKSFVCNLYCIILLLILCTILILGTVILTLFIVLCHVVLFCVTCSSSDKFHVRLLYERIHGTTK